MRTNKEDNHRTEQLQREAMERLVDFPDVDSDYIGIYTYTIKKVKKNGKKAKIKKKTK